MEFAEINQLQNSRLNFDIVHWCEKMFTALQKVIYEFSFSFSPITVDVTQYDIEKGLLLKLDSFLQIQLGTVFRGLSRVPDEEVKNLYRNRSIPIAYVEG